MNEFGIKFDEKSKTETSSVILISVDKIVEEELLYKFFVGSGGKWMVLQDFSRETKTQWEPEADGNYSIMVQAKRENEQKTFNYISKTEYAIGENQNKNKIITDINLDRTEVTLGEKIMAVVASDEKGVLYKYSLKENDKWILLKDFSPDDSMIWTATKTGEQEFVVQCKKIDSRENYDDIEQVKFNVLPIKKVEIKDFKCISEELLKGSELTFEVEVEADDNRLLLYKFIKINAEGIAECIQNYSTKRIVSYVERGFGQFKILCLVKDMYSINEYDERALIIYNVKKYKPIKIVVFTSDVTSPQMVGREINLKTTVNGGNELLYRFLITGEYEEDSGYVKKPSYCWKPREKGRYKISLMVKDSSFEGGYEARETIEFEVDEVNREPVVIKDVIADKKDFILVGDIVNIKAIAEGGTEIKYSFIVREKDKILENISYGSCNWVNYSPDFEGDFELEIRAKDKFSNKEYDARHIMYFSALKYIPAKIDYVLVPSNEYYIVGDTIELNIIARNTSNILNKFILKVNNRIIEETNYENAVKYKLKPRYEGIYTVEIYAKNVKSNKDYDCKKQIKIVINEGLPVTNTTIECDKAEAKVNEVISFSVSSNGGKEVEYEFYLMEKNDWILVQKYSRKSFYSFIPFTKGKYKILVLAKSQLKRISYEDYSIFEFEVEN